MNQEKNFAYLSPSIRVTKVQRMPLPFHPIHIFFYGINGFSGNHRVVCDFFKRTVRLVRLGIPRCRKNKEYSLENYLSYPEYSDENESCDCQCFGKFSGQKSFLEQFGKYSCLQIAFELRHNILLRIES